MIFLKRGLKWIKVHFIDIHIRFLGQMGLFNGITPSTDSINKKR